MVPVPLPHALHWPTHSSAALTPSAMSMSLPEPFSKMKCERLVLASA
jgi:hypothetical protein